MERDAEGRSTAFERVVAFARVEEAPFANERERHGGIGRVDLPREPVTGEDRLGDHARRVCIADQKQALDPGLLEAIAVFLERVVDFAVGHSLGHRDDCVAGDRLLPPGPNVHQRRSGAVERDDELLRNEADAELKEPLVVSLLLVGEALIRRDDIEVRGQGHLVPVPRELLRDPRAHVVPVRVDDENAIPEGLSVDHDLFGSGGGRGARIDARNRRVRGSVRAVTDPA